MDVQLESGVLEDGGAGASPVCGAGEAPPLVKLPLTLKHFALHIPSSLLRVVLRRRRPALTTPASARGSRRRSMVAHGLQGLLSGTRGLSRAVRLASTTRSCS